MVDQERLTGNTMEMVERLAKLETNVETLLSFAREDREARQKIVGLVGSVGEINKDVVDLTASMKALYNAVDPMIHSSPPVVMRIRSLEDDMLKAQTKERVWRTIAVFVAPLMTALMMAWVTGQFRTESPSMSDTPPPVVHNVEAS